MTHTPVHVRRAALLGGSALLSLALADSALAEEQPAQPAQGSLTEIVVTAQKRAQNLQDVPIAISAISQDQLKSNRITNVLDLTAQAPNLFIRESAGSQRIPNFSMRGAVSFGSVAGQEKSISLYLDGVYLGLSAGSTFELPDIERIEVLRGPQGTLFGRNSTAGAINVITREPTGVFKGRQVFTYGNYNTFRSSTRLDLPAWGPFSASISYTHSEHEGDVKNLGAGTVWNRSGPLTRQGVEVSPKTLGADNSEAVFAAIKFDPGTNFKSIYRFDWTRSDWTPQASCAVGFNPASLGAATNAVLLAVVASEPNPTCNQHRPTAVNNAFSTPGLLLAQGHSLTSTLDLDRFSLKNILAYRWSYIYGNADLGGLDGVVTPAVEAALEARAHLAPGALASQLGSPFVISGANSFTRGHQWSDELQLIYKSKLLTLTTGVYFYDLKSSTGSPEGLPGSTNLAVVPNGTFPTNQRNLTYNHNQSIAGYVQAEVHVTPQLDLVGGYRLTHDEKTGTSYIFLTSATPPSQISLPLRYKDTRSTFSLGANYKPTRDLMVYAKYSTGFVSGGSVSGYDYAPETVKAWEGGLKSELFDRKLRFNLALFKADYDHLQFVSGGQFLTPPDPRVSTVVIDEGDLKTWGFEAEATLAPTRGLTLNASTGYTHSEFSRVNPLVHPLSNQVTIRPPWTASVGAQYETLPVSGDMTMMFRIDANWRDKFRALTNPDSAYPAVFLPVTNSAAMWLVNARVALRNIPIGRTRAELAGWVKNLTDSDNPAQPVAFASYLVSTNYTHARTFGVDLSIDF